VDERGSRRLSRWKALNSLPGAGESSFATAREQLRGYRLRSHLTFNKKPASLASVSAEEKRRKGIQVTAKYDSDFKRQLTIIEGSLLAGAWSVDGANMTLSPQGDARGPFPFQGVRSDDRD